MIKKLTGMRFNRLTVISENGRTDSGGVKWLCKCDCGNESTVASSSLLSNHTESCGCLQKEAVMANKVNITGHKFGKLIVISDGGRMDNGAVLWTCKCECGNEVNITSYNLRHGITQSCGCGKINDLTGQKFGRLTVVAENGRTTQGRVNWLCRCDCGTEVTVNGNVLNSGNKKSCGCLHKETGVNLAKSNVTHGYSDTPEYYVWGSMISRCTNPNDKSYQWYGGRGITVCDRWLNSVTNFIMDMGPRPSGQHSIDRVDSNGNYEPCNCKWSTMEEQQNNRRDNHIVTYKGKEYTTAELARENGISAKILRQRLNRDKWSVEAAVETPIEK